MKSAIGSELKGVIAFVGVIWGVFLLTIVFPSLNDLGVRPRSLTGLVGIPAMPFLHASLGHLVGNTAPLFVLLMLLAGSQARSWAVGVAIVLLGGLLLWLFGRSTATHIGASGLICGLIGFLILSGCLERRLIPLVVTIVVGFLYGGTLLSGIVPRLGSNVSWDGHLCGAIAGGIVAFAVTRIPDKEKTPAN